MDHNQATVVAVAAPWKLKVDRLEAHKLTFQLTFTHGRSVSHLLVLAVVTGQMMGRSAEHFAQQGQNVGTVGFPRDQFRRPCVRRACFTHRPGMGQPPIIATCHV